MECRGEAPETLGKWVLSAKRSEAYAGRDSTHAGAVVKRGGRKTDASGGKAYGS